MPPGAAGKKQDSSASGVTAVGGGGSCTGKEELQAELRQALLMFCACFRAVPGRDQDLPEESLRAAHVM